MKVTTSPHQQSSLLHILQQAKASVSAIDLADKLQLAGTHETKRRKIRDLIQKLRDNGHWIVASQSGYWLTADPAIWKSYNEHRSIDAKIILKEISSRKQTQRDIPQGMLFDPAEHNAVQGGM